MNWLELKRFIETLNPEQMEYEIFIIDEANDVALEVIEANINDEATYCTFHGTILQSEVDSYIEEELKDLEDDTYLKIENNVPYICAQW